MPCFISNFLSDRLFQVKIGSTLSDFHVQENGVPQGSILSPVLFNIKINDIVKTILKDSESSLFVDNLLRADHYPVSSDGFSYVSTV